MTVTSTEIRTPDYSIRVIRRDGYERNPADVLEAHQGGGSSNDIACILDDWFVTNGFPTILYRQEQP